jgi:hypothetical protein
MYRAFLPRVSSPSGIPGWEEGAHQEPADPLRETVAITVYL